MAEQLTVENAVAAEVDEAAAKQADRDELKKFLTATSIDYDGTRQKAAQQLGLQFSRYMWENPAYYVQKVYPRQSEATALGLVYVASQSVYDLCDEMRRKEPLLMAGTNAVTSNVARREISIVPMDDPDDDAAQAFAAEASKVFEQHFPVLILSLCENMIVQGSVTHEVIWHERDGQLVPLKIIHRHPGQFVYDELGTQYLYSQRVMSVNNLTPVPPFKFFNCVMPAPYGNPYGRSLFFDLQYHFTMIKSSTGFCMEYLERSYQPILAMMTKISQVDTKDFPALMQNLKTQLEALSTGYGIILGSEVADIKSVARGDSAGDPPHAAFRRELLKECLVYLMGSTLGIMESEYGTRAQADVHQASADIRTRPLALLIAEALTELVNYWRVLNYGDKAPRLRVDIDTSDPANVKELRASIESAVKHGAPVPVNVYYDRMGIPAPQDGEPLLKAPETAAPANPAAPFSAFPDDPEDEDDGPDDTDPKDPKPEGDAPPAGDEGEGDADTFAEGPDLRLARERGYLDRLLKLATLATEEMRKELIPAFRKAAESGSNEVDASALEEASLPILGAARILGTMISLQHYEPLLKERTEFAEYQGREVALGKPFRTPGEAKKFAVYVKNDSGRVVKVRFGDPNAEIKRDDDGARKNFRARHQCDTNPGPKWKARYWSCRMWDSDFSVSDVLKASDGARMVRFAELPEDLELDERFVDSVRWLMQRDLLTVREVRELARAAQAGNPALSPEVFVREIRRQSLALARTTGTKATEQFRDAIARSVNDGGTLAEFLKEVDAGLNKGLLPGTSDAYVENVFRTETANAYTAQREAWQAEPEIDSVLWGVQIMNPEDGRSRESHARLNGVYFEKGSAAYTALGSPPFSYQCRCVAVPVILPNPKNPPPEVREPENALDLARAVERFSEHHEGGCCG